MDFNVILIKYIKFHLLLNEIFFQSLNYVNYIGKDLFTDIFSVTYKFTIKLLQGVLR